MSLSRLLIVYVESVFIVRVLCAQNTIQINLKTVFKYSISKYLKYGQHLGS